MWTIFKSGLLGRHIPWEHHYHYIASSDGLESKRIKINNLCKVHIVFPQWLSSKESACNAGDPGSISGSGRPLEKEMATHSSILAWRIPWREEACGLQSIGSQRVRHKWSKWACKVHILSHNIHSINISNQRNSFIGYGRLGFLERRFCIGD